MTLWAVELGRYMVIDADTETEAHRLAIKYERAETWNCPPDIMHAHKVSDIKEIPKEWRDSLPWGGDGKRTCEQILESSAGDHR